MIEPANQGKTASSPLGAATDAWRATAALDPPLHKESPYMREFDVVAVLEGKHPSPPLPELQMIVQDDLTAVLSATPRPLKRPAQSLQHHLHDAATHLRWQTACMWLAPLLPVRLDTPLTRSGAAAMLTANTPFLTQLLARFAGMAQVQVSVIWKERAALTRFGTGADRTALSGKAGDTGPALAQIAGRLSALIGAELAAVCTEIAPLPLGPDLLWSGVVLLPLRKLGDLNQVLRRIEAIWPEGLHVGQLGPDPVTSFATLDLSPVTPRQIDLALQSFGLQTRANLGQLAAVRRRRLTADGLRDDATRRAEIGEQVEILAAAARLPDLGAGFALCRIWTDGRVIGQPPSRAVA